MSDTVLIVGAGPVGLAMALELSRYKVPVRIIDKMAGRADTSRAVSLWSRTLELLDRSGVSKDLLGMGNRVTAANIIAGGHPIVHLDLGRVDTPYPFALMLPQCDTEAVLERHLDRFGVKSELGVELTAFSQDAGGVTATLRHADGRVETAKTSWLVACDGAHSPVRHGLGLSFEGSTMAASWILGDFHMTGWSYPLDELATYWHPNGIVVFFPMGPGRYRIIASVDSPGNDKGASPTLADFQAIVDQRGPGGLVLTDSLWTTAFKINERQASSYRSGRIFLAGDAAHVHSPAGGQGMNTGIQDAMNLGWKLAMVCRGLSSDSALLDSYDIERKAVGAAVIAAAGRLTNVAMVQNPVAQHVRDGIMHLMFGLAPVRKALAESMTEISIGYAHSPLNGVSHGHLASAGARMRPHEDEVPYGAGDIPRYCLRTAAGTAVPLANRYARLIEPLARPADADAGIQLVRPDGYLAMSAASGDWRQVEKYLGAHGQG